MPLQSRHLALLAVTALAATLTACSSGSSHPTAAPASTGPASTATAAVPAGYKRVGGASQGISLAVPSPWADVDLSKQSAARAVSKLKLSSVAAAQLTGSLAQLQQSKAIVAADLKYAATARGHFTRNINAYCTQSGVTDTGAAAIPLIKAGVQSQLSAIATHLTEQDTTIGGIAGLQTSYEIKSGTVGAFYGSQLEVAPKAGTACFVTLTALEPGPGSDILAEAAKTAQFP